MYLILCMSTMIFFFQFSAIMRPMGFGSRGPSVLDTSRSALTEKAWEEAVQGPGLTND